MSGVTGQFPEDVFATLEDNSEGDSYAVFYEDIDDIGSGQEGVTYVAFYSLYVVKKITKKMKTTVKHVENEGIPTQ